METKKSNLPEAKLGQYKGLAVTRHVRPVTEQTLQQELVHQTRTHAVYHNTNAPAKAGDRVMLDFVGYMDGEEIPNSKMEKVMVVLGDGKLMTDAENAIYGHKAGEVFHFDFTYPADFRIEELSGKTAQFEINLHSVAEKSTPELNEEFAKAQGYDSLDAMKESFRAKKQAIHEAGADRAAAKEMDALRQRLSRSKMTLEQHCQKQNTTPEALEKGYRDEAEKRIRVMLAARTIADAEGIVVRPEEVNLEYQRLSQMQDTPVEEIRKALPEEAIATALAAQKVQKFLLDNAVVTTVMDSAEKE